VHGGAVDLERPWPVYLGSAARTGLAAGAAPADTSPRAQVKLSRGIAGAPAVGRHVLVVMQTDRQVAVLSRDSLAVRWRERIELAPGAGPVLQMDRLFVAEHVPGGRVYAFRLRDGERLWRTGAGDVLAPLALDGPRLYAGLVEGAVLQLDAETGATNWGTRVRGAVRAAPVPVPGGVIVATDADSLFLLDAASGAVRARAGTAGAVLAAPALADSLVVVGTAAGAVAAYDARSLERRWSVGRGAAIVGSVALSAGTAWAVRSDGTLLAVPLERPESFRSAPTGLTVRAGPAPAAGGALLASVDGWIARYDEGLERRWLARLRGPVTHALVLDEGETIAVTQNGRVAVFR
jgi:hypothetical protein